MLKNLGGKNWTDAGLLVVRVGLGIMFMIHGWPKISGGPEKWTMIGGAMQVVGVTFLPVFWGLMAAVAEFFGGLALASGKLFRPACAMLAFTMAIATAMHLNKGDGLAGASHALEAGIVFIGLFLTGPGKYRIK